MLPHCVPPSAKTCLRGAVRTTAADRHTMAVGAPRGRPPTRRSEDFGMERTLNELRPGRERPRARPFAGWRQEHRLPTAGIWASRVGRGCAVCSPRPRANRAPIACAARPSPCGARTRGSSALRRGRRKRERGGGARSARGGAGGQPQRWQEYAVQPPHRHETAHRQLAGKDRGQRLGTRSAGRMGVFARGHAGDLSLLSHSPEEEAARDAICFGGADVVAVVCDATCLERGLELALQVMALTRRSWSASTSWTRRAGAASRWIYPNWRRRWACR